ncbi:hypothetical protein [Hydrogenophaga sp.]|uniref:hypothetical protein n=1 Tax=Hydrogenophaga sp. TaxID=1904254 RepID=UPI003F6E7A8B
MPFQSVRHAWRLSLLLGLQAALPSASWAQTYNCSTPSGTRYQSTKPCRAGHTPGITYYGPKVAPQSNRKSTPVPLPRAGDELTYMGPKCASMQEAIRTAPARSIDAVTVRELRRNFDIECREEHQQALQKLNADKREKRNQAHEREKEEGRQKSDAQQAEKKLMDQCAEMRRAIHLRKQRPTNSEGEARDLQRFEERYQLRCVQSASR